MKNFVQVLLFVLSLYAVGGCAAVRATGDTVRATGEGTAGAVSGIGRGAGEAVSETGRGAGHIVSGTGRAIQDATEEITE